MPKFIVHLFPLVRVKYKAPVEAATYEEAVEKTLKGFRPRAIFDRENDEMVVEDAEEVQYACVDIEGDTEFEKTRWVSVADGPCYGTQIYAPFIRLVDWARRLCECFGAPPQVVCDAMDVQQQIYADIAAQKKGPQ